MSGPRRNRALQRGLKFWRHIAPCTAWNIPGPKKGSALKSMWQRYSCSIRPEETRCRSSNSRVRNVHRTNSPGGTKVRNTGESPLQASCVNQIHSVTRGAKISPCVQDLKCCSQQMRRLWHHTETTLTQCSTPRPESAGSVQVQVWLRCWPAGRLSSICSCTVHSMQTQKKNSLGYFKFKTRQKHFDKFFHMLPIKKDTLCVFLTSSITEHISYVLSANENRILCLQFCQKSGNRISHRLVAGSIHSNLVSLPDAHASCARHHSTHSYCDGTLALTRMSAWRRSSQWALGVFWEAFLHWEARKNLNIHRITSKPYTYIPLNLNWVYSQLTCPLAKSPKCLCDGRRKETMTLIHWNNIILLMHILQNIWPLFLSFFLFLPEQFGPKASRWDRAA